MHIELVDLLRCPSPHEETWLVAAVTQLDGRDIVEGTLGCPICHRRVPVRDGEVDFVDGAGGAPGSGASVEAVWASAVGSPPAGAEAVAPDDVGEALLRARALLGLDDGGGTILIGGVLARHAASLADSVAVKVLLLNPRAAPARAGSPPSAIRAAGGVPLAAGVLRAAWLDEATSDPSLLAGVVRALRPGGRLVAPAATGIPAGIRELARDAREWVGARDAAVPAASAPVSLRRR